MSEIPGAVVGRAEELAALRSAVEAVISGRGQAVLIEGEPGIGKSALLASGLAGAVGRVAEMLSVSCDELGQHFPLSVMTRLLGVNERSADPRRAEVAAVLRRPETSDAWGVRLLAGDPVMAAVEQLLALVDRLCMTGPVVLAMEDLQWADEASLLLWRRLCRASVQLPLLVVGTCRPVPRREELKRLRRELKAYEGVLISLGPLTDESVSTLATHLVDAFPGQGLTRRLRLAAGNPLYVRELLDALSRSGALRRSQGIVEAVDEDADGDAVVSLAEVIADRLDFLSVDTREVLRTASLLGTDFSASELAALVDRIPTGVARAVEEALAAGVLESVGATLRFRHELLKQSLYETTPTALRATLHRHAAEVLIASGAPAERIANLLLPVLAEVDGWEVAWLAENAAELAARAPAIAAQLLEHALVHTREGDPGADVLEDQLAAVCLVLARHEQAERIARGILLRSDSPQRVGQAAWFLGYALLSQGRFDEAAKQVGDATEDVRIAPVWRTRLTALQAMILPHRQRLVEAAEVAARALAEGELLGDPTTMAYALNTLAAHRAMVERDSAGALDLVDRGLTLAGSRPDLTDLRLLLLANRAAVLVSLDQADEARDTLRQARALAERVATPRLAMIQVRAAEHAFDHGRWDEALTELDAMQELPDQFRFPLYRHGLTALIAVRRGDRQQTVRHLKALSALTPSPDLAFMSIYLLMARALDAERAGRLTEAVAMLRPLLSPAYEENLPSREEWLPVLVRLALALGDERTARGAADACERSADRVHRPIKQAAAAWCRGLVEADPAAVLKGADYFRSVGRAPLLGWLLEDAASLQAQLGEVGEARATMAEAVAVYGELDALNDSRRAAARLRALGVRLGARGPQRRPKTGWQALTATELNVAELVAQGESNPEIASRLHLSRRTVENHVSHILTKLQVRSRREVADFVIR